MLRLPALDGLRALGRAGRNETGSAIGRRQRGGRAVIAAVYARKSTPDERSAADGNSAERQIARAREFAASRGWAVADRFVFKDEDVSGTVPPDRRPGSSKLLES